MTREAAPLEPEPEPDPEPDVVAAPGTVVPLAGGAVAIAPTPPV